VCVRIPKNDGEMSKIRVLTMAAKRLRGFGLALLAILASAGFALVGLSGANSSSNASTSTIDFAASLNGTNQHFIRNSSNGGSLTGAIPTNGDFSVEAWFFEDSGTTGCRDIFGVGDTGQLNQRFLIRLDGTASNREITVFQRGSNASTSITNRFVGQGQWNHVAVTHRAGQYYEVFLNGQIVRRVANTSTVAHTFGNVTIGKNYFSDTCWFDGQIDEVRTWNREISIDEIVQNMHRRVPADTSGLLYYWDFNEGGTGNAFDAKQNAPMVAASAPNRFDIKQVAALSSGETVVTFPRTYLPGVGGWLPPGPLANVSSLVVAGGGSGGSYVGGGGGGGGVRATNLGSLNPTTYSIVVGQGGVSVGSMTDFSDRRNGVNGQNSAAFGTVSIGGGGGGGVSQNGLNGGSGGGAGFFNDDLVAGGAGAPGQGFAGGQGIGPRLSPSWFTAGAGGGGAAGQGENVNNSTNRGGNGGAGTASPILGTQLFFGGGGGGGAYNTANGGRGGNGGVGGGGAGSVFPQGVSTTTTATGGGSSLNSGESSSTRTEFSRAGSGGANSGGGGGGVGLDGVSGFGGSGVVIVRYSSQEDNAVSYGLSTANDFDYVGTSSALIPNAQFTIEAWIRPESYSGNPIVFSQGAVGARVLVQLQANGAINYAYGGSTAINVAGATAPLNTWTHIALTRDSSFVPRFYVNGTVVSTGAANNGAFSDQFRLGEYVTGAFDFAGQIDQVKVWSTVLDAPNLSASMDTYSTSGVTGTLLAHYDFNETSGDIELDRAGGGRHLFRNQLSSGSIGAGQIIESGFAHTVQTYVKFNRSYLTATGGWTLPAGVSLYKALVVAGGGGGGGGPSQNNYDHHMNGGGGGAGGLTASDRVLLVPGTVIPVAVGRGGLGTIQGAANADTAAASRNGGLSRLGSTSALGGGAGGYMSSTGTVVAATSGGSGGGGGAQAGSQYPISGAAGTSGQGRSGGCLLYTSDAADEC
jgi:hypothetical protein